MKGIMGVVFAAVRGRAGGTVASVWRGVQSIRSYNDAPANPQTADQMLTRASISLLTKVWQHADVAVRDAWDKFASKLQMAGVNAFAKANIHNQIASLWSQLTPSDPQEFPLASIIKGATAPTTQVYTWTPGDAVATHHVLVKVYKDVQPLTPGVVDENDAIAKFSSKGTVLVSAGTITATGLITATDYRIDIAVIDNATGFVSKSLSSLFTTT